MLWHMRLGMEMVLEDYVHDARMLRTSLLFNTLFTAAAGVAALLAILRMVLEADGHQEFLPITDHSFDVVVVGAGGAGLRATLGASQAD